MQPAVMNSHSDCFVSTLGKPGGVLSIVDPICLTTYRKKAKHQSFQFTLSYNLAEVL